MEKKYSSFVFFGILIILLFMVLVFVKVNQNLNPAPDFDHEVSPSADLALDFNQAATYLFTSETCPHCLNVDKHLAQNPEASQSHNLVTVSLDHLATQKKNNEQLLAFAQICQLDNSTVGIPFIYINDESLLAAERCLSGDAAIINHLSTN